MVVYNVVSVLLRLWFVMKSLVLGLLCRRMDICLVMLLYVSFFFLFVIIFLGSFEVGVVVRILGFVLWCGLGGMVGEVKCFWFFVVWVCWLVVMVLLCIFVNVLMELCDMRLSVFRNFKCMLFRLLSFI